MAYKASELELELELIQTQMAQKPMLRAEVSSKRLLLEHLAGGAPPSLPPRSTAVATEAVGTPVARFLPLPFSSVGQLVQPLNKGCIKNLVAVTSPNLNVALGESAIRQVSLRTPPGGVKGLATRAARAAHSGLRAAAHKMASSAVYISSLPKKAVLRSEAEKASAMAAHVSCGRVSQAFLAIFEPERQGWADSGMS
jgi:hypothetical protein